MERSFYNEDFEQLLKEKADQYKMYPSDNVWKGIHHSLHSRRKWYWLGFALLLSGVSYYGIHSLLSPAPPKQIAKNNNSNIVSGSSTKETSKKSIQNAVIVPFSIPGSSGRLSGKDLSRSSETDKLLNTDNGWNITSLNNSPDVVAGLSESAKIVDLYADRMGIPSGKEANLQFFTTGIFPSNENKDLSTNTSLISGSSDAENVEKKVVEAAIENEDHQRINWLQEFALHELVVPRTKRISWQIAFSPTMNFRKLTGSSNSNMESLVKNVPIALNIEEDLNNLVNHKPALGFELGSHMLYAINKDVTFKVGLQFNYSRYDIQAYSSNSSDRATITLNSVSRHSVDSLTSYTHISNFGGDATQDLQNQYFQLSAPIGLEYRLLGNKKLQIFLAGTVQPTYLMNRNTYLITTDYKNYTHEPSLVRRWNLNTSAEAFVSYKTGGVRWQVGPQFRYQVLSSYANEYPIKEYLIEYGIKIGVSKTIR